MLLRRSSVLRPFVVHVKPVSARQADYEPRHVAVLMLIAEPGHRREITPELVARTLELTRAEIAYHEGCARAHGPRNVTNRHRVGDGSQWRDFWWTNVTSRGFAKLVGS